MMEEKNTHLLNYDQLEDGEIESSKTSLLIHDPARSGKATQREKIEE